MSKIPKLFNETVEYFNKKNIFYYITRNYENYPDYFTGDIDIYIDLEQFKKFLVEFEEIIVSNEFIIFLKFERPWMSSYQLMLKDKLESRRIITIEFFNFTKWLNFEYVDINNLKEYRKKFKNFYAIEKNVGLFLTFLHYFFWAGFFPQKYHKDIKVAFDSNELWQLNRKVFPKYISSLLEKEIKKYVAQNESDFILKKDVPEKIYLFNLFTRFRVKIYIIIRNFFNKPFNAFIALSMLIYTRIRDLFVLRGYILVYPQIDSKIAKTQLETIKKYHLFKNKDTKIISLSRNLFTNMLNLVRIYNILSKGGACILINSADRIPELFTRIFRKKVIRIPFNNPTINELIDTLII